MEDHIYSHCATGLHGFHELLVTRDRLRAYSDRVTLKGGAYANVWSFLDGCKWPITRPGGNINLQRPFYSGYICGHAFSYHVLSTPDGMIVHMHGPLPGKDNDITTLIDSNLAARMAALPGWFSCVPVHVTLRQSVSWSHVGWLHACTEVFTDATGRPFAVYADSIYTGHEGPHIIAPYTGINSPACMKHMNKVMSGLRISV